MSNACAASCERVKKEIGHSISLLSGAVVCNFRPSWLAECRARHDKVMRIMSMESNDGKRRAIESISNPEERKRVNNEIRSRLGLPIKAAH